MVEAKVEPIWLLNLSASSSRLWLVRALLTAFEIRSLILLLRAGGLCFSAGCLGGAHPAEGAEAGVPRGEVAPPYRGVAPP